MINSAVVKLSRLQHAVPVYRTLTMSRLPAGAFQPNSARVMGAFEVWPLPPVARTPARTLPLS